MLEAVRYQALKSARRSWKSIHTTNGLLLDVVEGVGSSVDDLAGDLVCPTTVVSEAANAHADVNLGHGNGLSVVERLNRSEEVNVLLEEVGEVHEQLAAVLGCLLPP
jgi:hypothetical protein